MNAKRASILVLAKMALQDGLLVQSEMDFLGEMARELGDISVEELIAEARRLNLEILLQDINSYPDRFFIALRAYMLAHLDEHFDIEEETLFESLIKIMKVSKEDRALIIRAELASRQNPPPPPEPQFRKLYEGSSFFIEGT